MEEATYLKHPDNANQKHGTVCTRGELHEERCGPSSRCIRMHVTAATEVVLERPSVYFVLSALNRCIENDTFGGFLLFQLHLWWHEEPVAFGTSYQSVIEHPRTIKLIPQTTRKSNDNPRELLP